MEPWVSTSRLERVLDGRLDSAWVAEQWRHTGARVIGVDDRSNVSSDDTGDQLRWITPDDVPGLPLAPLSTEHLLPLAWPGRMP